MERNLRGWAITRIPPMAPYGWAPSWRPVSLVNLSRVVLQEDLVECSRADITNDWLFSLKT